MNGNQDINLNSTECLRTVSDFGVSRVHNICNGTVTDVPWGNADWAIAVGLTGFVLIIVFVFASLALMIFKDTRW